MRRLGAVPTAELAEQFAAALGNRGIGIEVRREAEGPTVWVNDEDQLEEAKSELAAFSVDPQSERFKRPTPPPPVLSGEEQRASKVERRPIGPAWKRVPVTVAFIGMSVVITLAIWTNLVPALRGDLNIAPIAFEGDGAYWIPTLGLNAVRSGQVWRLVTPIFPHGDLLHLLGNMSFFWLLGSAIESVRGRSRLIGLVLVTAVLSNIAEYYFNFGFSFDIENGLRFQGAIYEPNPFFLGMSGVVFGLFGFIWMRSRLFRDSGFKMPRDMVTWMLIWLAVCTTGLVGPIANVAHAAGLVVGMIVGALPRLWRGDVLTAKPPTK